jgi:hypothetical protein
MTKNTNKSRSKGGNSFSNFTKSNKSGTNTATLLHRNNGVGGLRSITRGNNKRKITNTRDGVRVCYQDTVLYQNSPITGFTKVRNSVGGTFSIFPWLAAIANNFSKYRVHSIRAGFASTTPTTANGDVTLVWISDVQDSIAWVASGASESVFTMGKYATGPTWSGSLVNQPDACLSVTVSGSEVHQAMPWFYVGSGSGSSDNTRYAGAVGLQVSYNSTTVVTPAGRLFIEYDIEFIQPVSPLYNSLVRALGPIESGEQEVVNHPGDSNPGLTPISASESLYYRQINIPRSPRSLNLEAMDVVESQSI